MQLFSWLALCLTALAPLVRAVIARLHLGACPTSRVTISEQQEPGGLLSARMGDSSTIRQQNILGASTGGKAAHLKRPPTKRKNLKKWRLNLNYLDFHLNKTRIQEARFSQNFPRNRSLHAQKQCSGLQNLISGF